MDTIRLCERCYGPIAGHEGYVRLGHVRRANPDGSIEWTWAYVHTIECRLSTRPRAVTR